MLPQYVEKPFFRTILFCMEGDLLLCTRQICALLDMFLCPINILTSYLVAAVHTVTSDHIDKSLSSILAVPLSVAVESLSKFMAMQPFFGSGTRPTHNT